MNREWKPGDVAVRTYLGRVGRSHFVAGWACPHVADPHWHHEGGGWDPSDEPGGPTYRPLAVIDPESDVDVARLAAAFEDDWGGCAGGTEGAMQAALRSLVEPPKPPEPTGLGAVVEDAEGVRWVRWALLSSRPWNSGTGGNGKYSDIAAVKVLSDGVQS